MILVIASMGVRVGMLVGLSIPFCFLLTFIILKALSIEFNFLVMMGLLLGLGMLIDGSIVVTEYADRKISRLRSKRSLSTCIEKNVLPNHILHRNNNCCIHL